MVLDDNHISIICGLVVFHATKPKQISKLAQEEKKKTPDVEILLLTNSAIVKFVGTENFIIRVSEQRQKKSYSKDDFEIVLSPKFYGNIHPIPLRGFIWTEIKKNGVKLGLLFFLLIVFLSFDSQNDNLTTISQMLVEANALFIGIFTLFTITQNRDLFSNRESIRRGMMHRMMQNDFFITGLAIISLLLSFITVALIETPFNFSLFKFQLYSWQIDLTSARLLGIFSLLLLVNCLISITQYYLHAMQTAVEGKMYLELLGSQTKSPPEDSD